MLGLLMIAGLIIAVADVAVRNVATSTIVTPLIKKVDLKKDALSQILMVEKEALRKNRKIDEKNEWRTSDHGENTSEGQFKDGGSVLNAHVG